MSRTRTPVRLKASWSTSSFTSPPTPKLLLILTGGTIGMFKTENGLSNIKKGMFEQQLSVLPQFQDPTQPPRTMPPSSTGRRATYDIIEFEPLLDSSNIKYEDWAKIATCIDKNYKAYDAFVVCHGTDTMAYTASALSFMFEHLGKMVVLTGSQIPLSDLYNDAVDNLLGAMIMASHLAIPEVCLYFNHKLLRGCRARKVTSSQLGAFECPNIRPLAEADVQIRVNWDLVLDYPAQQLTTHTTLCSDVVVVTVFPGLTAETLKMMIGASVRGVVLLTYGAGNAPDNNPAILSVLKEAYERDVVIVNITQCGHGSVTPTYATGVALRNVGVLPGMDMTLEAALTKLAYLLDYPNITVARVREIMSTALRGEITEPADQKPSLKSASFIHSVYNTIHSVEREHGDGGDMFDTDDANGVWFIRKALIPTLMCSAGAVGDVAELREMVEGGTEPSAANEDRRTALHLSAAEGHLKAVQYLISVGGDVNAVDRFGGSPLWDALCGGHVAVSLFLRKAGAKLNADKRKLGGRLCRYAAQDDWKSLKNLLDCGVAVDCYNYDFRTALHVAVEKNNITLAEKLLNAGASPFAADRNSSTPLMEASQSAQTTHTSTTEQSAERAQSDMYVLLAKHANNEQKSGTANRTHLDDLMAAPRKKRQKN